jgi:hypothetical protein
MTTDIGSTVSYSAAASLTMIGGFSINEWAAIVGICLGIATFLFNIYWKVTHTERRSYQRDDDETNRRGID